MSMERVKEIEERHKDWVEQQNGMIASEDIEEFTQHANDIQFLIDTVKQQNEQIEELKSVRKRDLEEAEKVIDEKEQRIEELVQANAIGNGHVKACEERIEYLEKALHEIVNIYHNAIPVVAPNDMKKVAELALNK